MYHKRRANSMKIDWINERLIQLANEAKARVEQRSINSQSQDRRSNSSLSKYSHPKLSSDTYHARGQNAREHLESQGGFSSLKEPLLNGESAPEATTPPMKSETM